MIATDMTSREFIFQEFMIATDMSSREFYISGVYDCYRYD